MDEVAAVVVDNGSDTIKAGLSGYDAPSAVFSTCISYSSPREAFIGDDAQSRRDVFALEYPIQRGIVTSWENMEKIWRHTFDDELGIRPQQHPVLVTEAPLNPKRNREKMAEILLEKFDFPAVHFEIPGVLSLYRSALTTGISVDCGDGVSAGLAIADGRLIESSVRRLDLAGRDITGFLSATLRERSLTESDLRIFSHDIKEELCYVAPDFQKELFLSAGLKNHKMEKEYNLPDGRSVVVGNERFRSTEILFQPVLSGQSVPGIHENLFQSVVESGKDLETELLGNIVVSGGSTLFPGFVKRLTKEISEKFTDKKIRVDAPPTRKYSVFVGGSVLCSLPSFSKCYTTRQEFHERGAARVHR